MRVACPDQKPGEELKCWKSSRDELPEEGDIIGFLKKEMVDGMDHAYAHEVLGPAIFGDDENGVPAFYVYRGVGGSWLVQGKDV
jgi:hypothetical protein